MPHISPDDQQLMRLSLGGQWQRPIRLLLPITVIFICLICMQTIFHNVGGGSNLSTKMSGQSQQIPTMQQSVNLHETERQILQKLSQQHQLSIKNSDKDLEKEVPGLMQRKLPAPKPGNIRMAAMQLAPYFAQKQRNQQMFDKLIRAAADLGAQVVLMPEAGICGLSDPENEVVYTTTNPDFGFFSVRDVAEELHGPTVTHYATLAKELTIYLVVTLIEMKDTQFYSTAVLLDPHGQIALVSRKGAMQKETDAKWITLKKETPEVCQTSFGKVGLLIGLDAVEQLPLLKEKGAKIILHTAAFYGKQTKAYLEITYPKLMKEYGLCGILCNWAASVNMQTLWQGYGLSRSWDTQGKVLASQSDSRGNSLLISDIRTGE